MTAEKAQTPPDAPPQQYKFSDIAQTPNDFIPLPASVYGTAIALPVLLAAGLFFAVKKIRARKPPGKT